MAQIHLGNAAHVVTGRRGPGPARSRYEWRVVDIARNVTPHEAKHMLTEQAEYGQWELARSVRFMGGARRVWLRRRILAVKRTEVR